MKDTRQEHVQTFEGGMNLDDDINILAKNQYRYAENLTLSNVGNGAQAALSTVTSSGSKFIFYTDPNRGYQGTQATMVWHSLHVNLSSGLPEDPNGVKYYNNAAVIGQRNFWVFFATNKDGTSGIYGYQLDANGDVISTERERLPNIIRLWKYSTSVWDANSNISTSFYNDKLYFTDNTGEIRVIDFQKLATYSITNYAASDISSGSEAIEERIEEPMYHSIVKGDGSFTIGTYMWCYKYWKKNGAEGAISLPSEAIHLRKTGSDYTHGQFLFTWFDTSLKFAIPGEMGLAGGSGAWSVTLMIPYSQSFNGDDDFITIYRIFFENQDSEGIASIVETVSVKDLGGKTTSSDVRSSYTGAVYTYTDKGVSEGEISIADLFVTSANKEVKFGLKAKHLEVKDGRMYVGNVNLGSNGVDVENFLDTSFSLTFNSIPKYGTGANIGWVSDKTGVQIGFCPSNRGPYLLGTSNYDITEAHVWQHLVYNSDINVVHGTRETARAEFVSGAVIYGTFLNPRTTISNAYYRTGESYMFGVVFLFKDGTYSNVKHVKEIAIPHNNDWCFVWNSKMRATYPVFTFTYTGSRGPTGYISIKAALTGIGVNAVKLVRARRTKENRRSIWTLLVASLKKTNWYNKDGGWNNMPDYKFRTNSSHSFDWSSEEAGLYDKVFWNGYYFDCVFDPESSIYYYVTSYCQDLFWYPEYQTEILDKAVALEDVCGLRAASLFGSDSSTYRDTAWIRALYRFAVYDMPTGMTQSKRASRCLLSCTLYSSVTYDINIINQPVQSWIFDGWGTWNTLWETSNGAGCTGTVASCTIFDFRPPVSSTVAKTSYTIRSIVPHVRNMSGCSASWSTNATTMRDAMPSEDADFFYGTGETPWYGWYGSYSSKAYGLLGQMGSVDHAKGGNRCISNLTGWSCPCITMHVPTMLSPRWNVRLTQYIGDEVEAKAKFDDEDLYSSHYSGDYVVNFTSMLSTHKSGVTKNNVVTGTLMRLIKQAKPLSSKGLWVSCGNSKPVSSLDSKVYAFEITALFGDTYYGTNCPLVTHAAWPYTNRQCVTNGCLTGCTWAVYPSEYYFNPYNAITPSAQYHMPMGNSFTGVSGWMLTFYASTVSFQAADGAAAKSNTCEDYGKREQISHTDYALPNFTLVGKEVVVKPDGQYASRIYVSTSSTDTTSDPLLQFTENDYIDLKYELGEITSLFTYKSDLMFFQTNAFGIVQAGATSMINDSAGNAISLGKGAALAGFTYLSDNLGIKSTNDIWSYVDGLYFINTQRTDLYWYKDGSSIEGFGFKYNLRAYFNQFARDSTIPLMIGGDQSVIWLCNGKNVLVFNRKFSVFESFLTFVPTFITNINQKLIYGMVHNSIASLYAWAPGVYKTFKPNSFNSTSLTGGLHHSSRLDIVINPNANMNKVFISQNINMWWNSSDVLNPSLSTSAIPAYAYDNIGTPASPMFYGALFLTPDNYSGYMGSDMSSGWWFTPFEQRLGNSVAISSQYLEYRTMGNIKYFNIPPTMNTATSGYLKDRNMLSGTILMGVYALSNITFVAGRHITIQSITTNYKPIYRFIG